MNAITRGWERLWAQAKRPKAPEALATSDIPSGEESMLICLSDWIPLLVGSKEKPTDPNAALATYSEEDGVFVLQLIVPVVDVHITEGYSELILENQTVNSCASSYMEGDLFAVYCGDKITYGRVVYMPEEGLMIQPLN